MRDLAERLGVRPTKTLGQNFVHDANTVRRIVKAAGLTPDDVVCEVGPGLGSLTLGLLGAAAHVVAVEIDARLAAQLPFTVAAARADRIDRLTVVTADALTVSATSPAATALVANLPYNVAVPVVLHLLEVLPTLHQGPGDGAVGGRRPADRRPWQQGVRRADRQGGLVGADPAGRLGAAHGVLAGAQRRLRRWSGSCRHDPPTTTADPRARSSPWSTPPSPSGARRCGAR